MIALINITKFKPNVYLRRHHATPCPTDYSQLKLACRLRQLPGNHVRYYLLIIDTPTIRWLFAPEIFMAMLDDHLNRSYLLPLNGLMNIQYLL